MSVCALLLVVSRACVCVCVCSQNNQHLVPAASRPTIRMRHSFLPKRPLNKPLKTEPMVAGWKQHKRTKGTKNARVRRRRARGKLFGLQEIEGHCYTQPHTCASVSTSPTTFSLPLSLSLTLSHRDSSATTHTYRGEGNKVDGNTTTRVCGRWSMDLCW